MIANYAVIQLCCLSWGSDRQSFCRWRGGDFPTYCSCRVHWRVPSSLEAGAVRAWSTWGCILTSSLLVSEAWLTVQTTVWTFLRLWRWAVNRDTPLPASAELHIPEFYTGKIIWKSLASVSHLHPFTCSELLMWLQNSSRAKELIADYVGSGWAALLKKWQPQKEIKLSCSCHWCRNCSCRSCLHWDPF